MPLFKSEGEKAGDSVQQAGESIADAAKHATSSAAKTVDPEREDKSTIQKAKEAIGMD